MKSIYKILLFTVVASGLHFGLTGCVADVGVSGGYYGPDHGTVWLNDGPWFDGGGRWGGGDRDGGHRCGGGIDVHPPGHRR